MKKFLIASFLLFGVCNLSYSADSYVPPCFTNPNGYKYCNANYGQFFYDETTNKFYMALISATKDRKFAEYNPKTKTVNWNTPITMGVGSAYLIAVNKNIAGMGGFAHVNSSIKTPAEFKAAEKQAEEKTKKLQEAMFGTQKKQEELQKKQSEQDKVKHQTQLNKLKTEGSLPACKKLYWKYSLNPLYMYSEQNREPFKDIEGTEKTYCQMKNGDTAMLQFEDKTSVDGYDKYRGLKLIDFTGKTKYYPWD